MQNEVITPRVLKERLAKKRAAMKKSWQLVSIPEDAPGAKRRKLFVGGSGGHAILSRLDDKDPHEIKLKLSEQECRSIRRSGFDVEATTAPPPDERLELRPATGDAGGKVAATKAALLKQQKAEKKAAAEPKTDEGGNS